MISVLCVCLSWFGGSQEPLNAGASTGPSASVVVSLSYSSHQRRVSWLETAELGGPLRRLTQPLAGSRIYTPVWSPDGQRVAFIRRTARGSGVYVVGVDGGAPNRVAKLRPFPAYRNQPLDWAADSSHLLFDRFAGMECQTAKPFRLRLTIASAASSSRDIDALPRPRRGVRFQDASFSPDGERLSYIVLDYGPKTCDGHAGDFETQLYTIGSDGTGRRLLAREVAIIDTAWSDDGQWLAYLAWNGEDCLVKIAAADGSQKRTLLPDAWCDGQIAWQPHGSAIAVAQEERLDVVDALSGQVRTLVDWSASFPGAHSFSPDGEWLAAITGVRPHQSTLVEIALIPLLGGGTPLTYEVRRKSPRGTVDDGDLIFR